MQYIYRTSFLNVYIHNYTYIYIYIQIFITDVLNSSLLHTKKWAPIHHLFFFNGQNSRKTLRIPRRHPKMRFGIWWGVSGGSPWGRSWNWCRMSWNICHVQDDLRWDTWEMTWEWDRRCFCFFLGWEAWWGGNAVVVIILLVNNYYIDLFERNDRTWQSKRSLIVFVSSGGVGCYSVAHSNYLQVVRPLNCTFGLPAIGSHNLKYIYIHIHKYKYIYLEGPRKRLHFSCVKAVPFLGPLICLKVAPGTQTGKSSCLCGGHLGGLVCSAWKLSSRWIQSLCGR